MRIIGEIIDSCSFWDILVRKLEELLIIFFVFLIGRVVYWFVNIVSSFKYIFRDSFYIVLWEGLFCDCYICSYIVLMEVIFRGIKLFFFNSVRVF